MRVAVVGGGIAGLAAAWELRDDAEVTVFEPGPLGGKIRTSGFCGHPVDEGPDAFITRTPQAIELCAELGLTDELVAPAAGRTLVWSGGRLRTLPEGLMLGVPRQLGGLATSGFLTPAGVARAGLDLVLPRSPVGDDISVGELITRRFGSQVTRQLVEPLIGGIHAARVDDLSAAATAPQLLAAGRRSRSLMLALRRAGGGSAGTGPLFLTPRGGLGTLVDRLAGRLGAAGVTIVPDAVRAVTDRRDARLEVVTAGGGDAYDGVVLAVPPAEAAGILGAAAPAELGAITATSVALVTLAVPAADLPAPPGINGILVPPDHGWLMTACSFGSSKWPHWASPGRTILRISAGRQGDERAFALDDEQLVGGLVDELNRAMGTAATPEAVRVSRWPGAFPHYRVGHLARVERAVTELAGRLPGVVLAGSGYRGAGVPACIGSGREAARALCRATAAGASRRP